MSTTGMRQNKNIHWPKEIILRLRGQVPVKVIELCKREIILLKSAKLKGMSSHPENMTAIDFKGLTPMGK
jgi:hypothetical protein